MRIHRTFDWLLLGSDDLLVHRPTIFGIACTYPALVNAAPPFHAFVCFPKRSRSEYTNIQHDLIQRIATKYDEQQMGSSRTSSTSERARVVLGAI